jgi:hypothetical protein
MYMLDDITYGKYRLASSHAKGLGFYAHAYDVCNPFVLSMI